MFFSKAKKSKNSIAAKGLTDGKLAVCANKPNCVSSFDTREDFFIEPLELKSEVSLLKLKELLSSEFELIIQNDNYFHFVDETPLFKFKDDLELLVEGKKIFFRSSSRVGYSDLSANRKRVERIKKLIISSV